MLEKPILKVENVSISISMPNFVSFTSQQPLNKMKS